MIRYVAMLRRRPGTTLEDFLHAWLGEHRRLALALPDVRDVSFHPTLRGSGPDPEYDGIGTLDFATVEDLERSLASAEARRLREHTGTFADPDRVARAVIDTGPAGDAGAAAVRAAGRG